MALELLVDFRWGNLQWGDHGLVVIEFVAFDQSYSVVLVALDLRMEDHDHVELGH